MVVQDRSSNVVAVEACLSSNGTSKNALGILVWLMSHSVSLDALFLQGRVLPLRSFGSTYPIKTEACFPSASSPSSRKNECSAIIFIQSRSFTFPLLDASRFL